jgi:predicted amidophosphoribosyltransferase
LAPCLAELLAFAVLTSELKPLLVPVPSSRENFIKRGYSPGLVIARSVRARFTPTLPVTNALRFRRRVADQSKLNTGERLANLAGAMLAMPSVMGRDVILVDDIVTTGATIKEAARAVSEAGGQVLGFVTFSETLLKTQAKN